MILLALHPLLVVPAVAEPAAESAPDHADAAPAAAETASAEDSRRREVSFEVDGAVHGQVFYAPNAASQQAHALGGPLVGAEIELRVDNVGVRAYAAVWPLPVLATLGMAVFKHQPIGRGTWYWGGDVGVAYAFGTPRMVAGPSIGIRRRFDLNQVSSVIGVRATVGIGYDLAESNDWVFLESGRSGGLHGSIVFTAHGPQL